MLFRSDLHWLEDELGVRYYVGSANCARPLREKLFKTNPESAAWWPVYAPLQDAAQAMALVQRFVLNVSGDSRGDSNVISWQCTAPDGTRSDYPTERMNRAIVTCVAKMRFR